MSALDLPLGLRYGVPIETYHADKSAISKSGLDDIARSPAIYWALHLDPNRPPPRERAGQLEGNLAHAAVLEPDEFAKRYRTIPNGAPRRPTSLQLNAKKPSPQTIEAVEYWHDWFARTGNATIITFDQRETAMRQAEAVHRLPEVREALGKGRAEVSAFTVDAATQEQVRCRPDFVYEVSDSQSVLLDLKTFASADPQEFARQAARKFYAAQAWAYSAWYAQASGREVLAFLFVVCTTEHPFLASVCMLDEPSMASGERYCRRNLDLYSQCKKSGIWPAWDGVQIISLPAWAMREDE